MAFTWGKGFQIEDDQSQTGGAKTLDTRPGDGSLIQH